MTLRRVLAAALVSLAAVPGAPIALADSTDADCVLRKDGETKEGASGHCSFSQRQGYVDIDLRNGTTYNLSPGDQPNHYRDQEGKKVVRTVANDGSHEYKWEGKKVIVRFRASGGGHESGKSGETPHDLRDLQGGPYVGGEVDDQMTKRGYRHIKDDQSGGEIWSYWRSERDGSCVVVHMGEKRHVKSAVYAGTDCR